MPPRSFRTVVRVLGGTFNNDLDLYTVDCSKVDSLPLFSIILDSEFGLAYGVHAQDYVAKVVRFEESCPQFRRLYSNLNRF